MSSSALGQSAIERLPLEIIHHIHFLNPDNALLATSKTMAAKFVATALPPTPTALWVVKRWVSFCETYEQPSEKDLYDYGNWTDGHPSFILEKRYTHTPRIIHLIMCTLVQKHPEHMIRPLSIQPPLDPSWLFTGYDSSNTLPLDVIHFIYHTYPTCPVMMSRAVRRLLSRQQWDMANALLECGANPYPYGCYRDFGPDYKWEMDKLFAKSCSCGWEAPALDETPLVKELYRIRESERITLKLVPPAEVEDFENSNNPLLDERVHASAHQYARNSGKIWKLPPYGRYGRNWCRLNQYDYVEEADNLFRDYLQPRWRSKAKTAFIHRVAFDYGERLWEIFGPRVGEGRE